MKKTIITAVGRDGVGIMSEICQYLEDNNLNILDITQTIVDGYFNMMMLTDISMSPKKLKIISKELDGIGKNMGISIYIQSEDIFTGMHRI